jgi:type II secretory pathway pseudopilin PulG
MSSVKCWNCNLVNFSTETHCRRCNNELGNGGASQSAYYGYSPQAQQASLPNPYQAPASPEPYNQTGSQPPYGAAPTGTVYSEPAPPTGTVYGGPEPSTGGTVYSGPEPGGPAYPGQGGYMPPNPYYNGYGAPPAKLKQGLAIASLTMGIVGLLFCFLGILGSIPGLICGIMAVKKVNRNPMEYGGKGMAIAGIVMNGLMLLTIPVIAAIAIPNLFAARKAANEASVIQSLQSLGAAQATYQSTNGRGSQFGTLEEMEQAGLVKAGSSQQNGYKFKLVVSNCPLTSGPGSKSCVPRFTILATPLSYGTTGSGKNSFYMDETYVIRAADNVGLDADRNAAPIIDTRRLDPDTMDFGDDD